MSHSMVITSTFSSLRSMAVLYPDLKTLMVLGSLAATSATVIFIWGGWGRWGLRVTVKFSPASRAGSGVDV